MPVWLKWAVAAVALLLALILLRRPLRAGLGLLGRTAASLLGLLMFGQVGGLIGVTLGVNLINALIVAILGLPGFGLLLMLNWVTQI